MHARSLIGRYNSTIIGSRFTDTMVGVRMQEMYADVTVSDSVFGADFSGAPASGGLAIQIQKRTQQ